MKWLFLIVRHCFPRKKWVEIGRWRVYEGYDITAAPIGYDILLRDQFGNLKKFRL